MRRVNWWRVLGLAFCLASTCFMGWLVWWAGSTAYGEPSPTITLVPQQKLVKAVKARDAARSQVKALRRTLRTSPDFQVSLRLAGIVYGQDWRALERCALSEGSRISEFHNRRNTRLNGSGSGAFSSFQFMRGTFLSTPFAALDWSRQDVQAFAAGWMWAHGRQSEWTGSGC